MLPIKENPTVQVISLPMYGCALWRHLFQNSIRKFTVSYNDAFKRLINVPRYTSSSLTFALNATDYITVVFGKFAYRLMSRVIYSPNSIVTAIVNSDAYHHRQDYPSICQCVMNDHVINQYRQHMTNIPILFSIFHILFRLYCLYL